VEVSSLVYQVPGYTCCLRGSVFTGLPGYWLHVLFTWKCHHWSTRLLVTRAVHVEVSSLVYQVTGYTYCSCGSVITGLPGYWLHVLFTWKCHHWSTRLLVTRAVHVEVLSLVYQVTGYTCCSRESVITGLPCYWLHVLFRWKCHHWSNRLLVTRAVHVKVSSLIYHVTGYTCCSGGSVITDLTGSWLHVLFTWQCHHWSTRLLVTCAVQVEVSSLVYQVTGYTCCSHGSVIAGLPGYWLHVLFTWKCHHWSTRLLVTHAVHVEVSSLVYQVTGYTYCSCGSVITGLPGYWLHVLFMWKCHHWSNRLLVTRAVHVEVSSLVYQVPGYMCCSRGSVITGLPGYWLHVLFTWKCHHWSTRFLVTCAVHVEVSSLVYQVPGYTCCSRGSVITGLPGYWLHVLFTVHQPQIYLESL